MPGTTIHSQLIGDRAVLLRDDLDRLVDLARRSESVEVEVEADDTPTIGIMQVAHLGSAFAWLADEDELYTLDDLKVRYE